VRSLVAVAVVVGGLLLGACSGSSSPAHDSATASTAPAARAAGWRRIDEGLEALGPKVGFLAAAVTPSGTCRPVHAIAASTARPMASQFKLVVLGAIARRIEAGRGSWDDPVTITDGGKSLGNSAESGSLQFAPTGTSVTVEEAATKMISISDNTAADLLIGWLGRTAVEAQARRWIARPAADEPFLTTREMLLLHYAPGLAERYLAKPRDRRAAFVASSVDPLPTSAIAAGYSAEPRHVSTVEWFASPDDVCRAFAGLERLAHRPGGRPLDGVLSKESGTIGLDRTEWPTIWFKGGSEAGVLTLGWLATRADGRTFVVEAMVSNPRAALADDSITQLVALARRSFARLR
jgi:beta-lactamase class A